MLAMHLESGVDRPTARARAVLRGVGGALDVEVLGYEFPDAVEGLDADWLVVRLECVRGKRWIRAEGAFLLSDELAAWGAWLIAAADEGAKLAFTEPNLLFAWRSEAAGRVVDVEVLRESCDGFVWMPSSFGVDAADLVAFGRSLQRITQRFPVRSARTSDGTVT